MRVRGRRHLNEELVRRFDSLRARNMAWAGEMARLCACVDVPFAGEDGGNLRKETLAAILGVYDEREMRNNSLYAHANNSLTPTMLSLRDEVASLRGEGARLETRRSASERGASERESWAAQSEAGVALLAGRLEALDKALECSVSPVVSIAESVGVEIARVAGLGDPAIQHLEDIFGELGAQMVAVTKRARSLLLAQGIDAGGGGGQGRAGEGGNDERKMKASLRRTSAATLLTWLEPRSLTSKRTSFHVDESTMADFDLERESETTVAHPGTMRRERSSKFTMPTDHGFDELSSFDMPAGLKSPSA
jgi:hypothetical protein